MAMKEYSTFPKAPESLNLTIWFFSVLSRTIVAGGVWALWIGAVGVFFSPSRQGNFCLVYYFELLHCLFWEWSKVFPSVYSLMTFLFFRSVSRNFLFHLWYHFTTLPFNSACLWCPLPIIQSTYIYWRSLMLSSIGNSIHSIVSLILWFIISMAHIPKSITFQHPGFWFLLLVSDLLILLFHSLQVFFTPALVGDLSLKS